ncbi:NapC/NirT family cytochrome c [Kosmotoga pacifica]|uniref:NapC/NirT cytochrome c N-terminal domain-containing protein n=1 Tax=Kosmotoga pacifica TaxID=1330330 RepID=A0A0G2ZDM2_9BACT|nr:NapC/NirT family cytochrome c [Kosmotoga pacifica]AKI97639.1 hypothetical protein IX53_07220 [Kosmotoga pacifica]
MKKILDFFRLIFEIFWAGMAVIIIGVTEAIRYGKIHEKILVVFLVLVVVLGLLALAAVEVTSTNGFCLSCHPYLEKEYYASTHGQAGVSCADCHIPEDFSGFVDAKLTGLKELWIYFTEDHPKNREEWKEEYKEKWEDEAYRINLTDDICLKCHGDEGIKPFRKVIAWDTNIHELLRVDEKGLSCFDCHYNFVHGIE